MGSVMYPVQTVSTPCFYLRAISLEQLLGEGKASRTHIARTGERVGAFNRLGPACWSTCGQPLVDDFLQRFPTGYKVRNQEICA